VLLPRRLKTLADEERANTKLIVVGINRVGDSLIKLAADLTNRVDIIKFEANPDERVRQVVEKGEAALNLDIAIKRR
jgi:hypothetical protein